MNGGRWAGTGPLVSCSDQGGEDGLKSKARSQIFVHLTRNPCPGPGNSGKRNLA
jgi:hypothetical protein